MRASARNAKLRSNVQALRVYPVEASTKTVAMLFDTANARALATRLLVLAEGGHKKIELTAFRNPRKSDQTLPVRVTARRQAS
jgi:hypothetical protein